MEQPRRAQFSPRGATPRVRAKAGRLWKVFTAVLLLAGALIGLAGPTFALSPTAAFEITDGNIVDDQPAPPAPTVDPYDWASLFETSGGVVVSTGVGDFETTSFVEDGISSDPLPLPCKEGSKGDLTTLVSGGSDKNGDPITEMEFEPNSVPNKDDITNTYAASKLVPQDAPSTAVDTIFYFALERAETNGDSYVDFEFLRQPVTLEVTGTDPATGCEIGHWVGTRSEGDILISMTFTSGGALGTPEIFLWVGDSTTGSYVLQPLASLPADSVGFFTNDVAIECGNWDCRDSTGETLTELEPRAFVEGYLNISRLLGTTDVGCYSTFNAKTRTSHSVTSELKDFALGSFNTCDAGISLSPSGVNATGGNHTFTAHVESNATGTMLPVSGAVVTGTITGDGTWVPAGDNICTTDATGNCTLTITSDEPGVSTVNASTTVDVSGTSITRSTATSSGPGGSGPATKNWVDDYIKVTPDDVNPVDQSHEFIVEYGVITDGATGLTAATPTITPSVSPGLTGYPSTTSCASPTVVSTMVWRCTFTINSSIGATYTATATGSTTVTMSGTPTPSPATAQVSASTTAAAKGTGGNEGATKTYVNARILATPNGLNESDNVNTPTPEDPHAITATVQVQDGSAAWVAAPTGTNVAFTVTGVGGFVGGTNTTTCATSADGTCTVQLNSSAVGTSTVSATASPLVDTVTVTRTTATAINTAQGGSADVIKKWANASITVVENDINAVGDNHTFTITVTPDAPADATVGNVSITPAISPSATVEANTCSSDVAVTGAGTYVCEYTINSSSAGVFDVDATTVVDFAWGAFDLAVHRSTAAGQYAGPSGNQGAVKTYVDARVAVGDDAVNQVGQPHTVTGHAEFHDGSPAGDAGWQDAVDETITFTITEGPGAFSNGASTITCQSGSAGTCSVTMVSSTPGVTWVSASTNYDVPNGGVVLFRSTATDGSNTSNDLRKEWVSATISITPDAVNEVGDEHVFTITVTATGPPATITIGDITYDVDPPGTTDDLVCAAAQATSTGKTRTCTLTIQSDIADVFTANASAQVTMEGLDEPIDLTTNATNGNSGPAVKTFVDARITITPDGVNEVGQPHTVTALVEVNDGTNGWLPLAGASVQLTEDGPGTIAAICGPTASNGTCAVDLTSTAPGVSVVHGRVELRVLGEPVTRDTNTAINTAAGGSGDLTKRWVDAFIAIAPLIAENPLNQAHVFTVTVTATTSGASPLSFDAITTSVAPSPDTMSSTCQTPTVSSNTATCSITINSATAGTFVANATATVTIGATTITRSTDASVAPFGPGGSGPATKEYVGAAVLGEVVSRPAAVQAAAPLPATGSDVRHPILIAFVLLALGAVFLAAGRTRSHALATRPSRKSE